MDACLLLLCLFQFLGLVKPVSNVRPYANFYLLTEAFCYGLLGLVFFLSLVLGLLHMLGWYVLFTYVCLKFCVK